MGHISVEGLITVSKRAGTPPPVVLTWGGPLLAGAGYHAASPPAAGGTHDAAPNRTAL